METAAPRALVVEDDRSWQQILSELLTDAGLTVDVADNLPAAVACLRAAPHRLAVIDLSLGGNDHRNQDGLSVLAAVQRHDPGCAALLLSGYATVELAVSALTRYGAFTCLRKETFRRAHFREVVRNALAGAPAQAPAEAAAGRRTTPDLPAGSVAAQPTAKAAGLALVVEDDAGWRGILAELLAEAGYQVRLCGSYGEALGYLRRESHRLAIVDLSLASSLHPGDNADGYRLLANTQALGIPSIVVSGAAAPQDVERAYGEYGIFAFLEKQAFERQAFRLAVQEAGAAAAANQTLDGLTPRERQVLALVAQGMTNKQIAAALVISTNTVKRHLKSIFAKLAVHTRAAAAAQAISAGLSRE